MPDEDTVTLARELTESVQDLMALLPDWATMGWRQQASLAAALKQVGSAMREAARQQNVAEMRLMYAGGEG